MQAPRVCNGRRGATVLNIQQSSLEVPVSVSITPRFFTVRVQYIYRENTQDPPPSCLTGVDC